MKTGLKASYLKTSYLIMETFSNAKIACFFIVYFLLPTILNCAYDFSATIDRQERYAYLL